jgi:NAD(P)-dependent dehydrogenase (short-subunit alcohol dehydrogenase family)
MADERRVAIITGGSQGIGAGVVAGYREQGWAVVASARSFKSAVDPDVVTVTGDIAEPATASRILSAALERFGHVDTLVNNAGVFVAKPLAAAMGVGRFVYTPIRPLMTARAGAPRRPASRCRLWPAGPPPHSLPRCCSALRSLASPRSRWPPAPTCAHRGPWRS